ncbi:Redoxin domain protein [Solidesulfovibrio fructosivorans JJ]]|uniref:Redoxin domain protein n=1 Tax=Solidesulfovibrio fructosivorans JJ] TaxID=596151 RepID=E1K0Y4_SOLFR|nr:TlpA disulfide reductase family protein [Solidesulfovibrio fructosivorans]EFL49749.1 Redoxin domain protein [Solidesulfovibrio fructosivorans JJ]]
MRKRIVFFMLALLFASVSRGLAQDAGPIKGQGVLDAVVAAQGKVVVVDFFASWCRPCLMEIPDFIEARRHYPPDKVVFIGVSLDQDQGEYFRFVKQTPFNFPVHLADPDVMSTFGVKMIPKTLIYDGKGQQAVNHAGYMPGDMLRQAIDTLLKDIGS